MMGLRATALLLLCVLAAGKKLPSYIQKCPSWESAELSSCALERGRAVIAHLMTEGDRDYGLQQIDEIVYPFIQSNNKGLQLNFTDLKITTDPPRSYVLDDLTIDLNGHKIHSSYSAPAIILHGKYTTDGRILVFSVKGEGDCTIRVENYKGHLSGNIQFEKNNKDGQEYFKLSNMKMEIQTSRVTYDFSNLFNGDPELGKATNAFLNENWKEVFEETKSGVIEATRQFLTNMVQSFFDRVPRTELAP